MPKKYYTELKLVLFELQGNCIPINFAKRTESIIEAIHENELKEFIIILEEGKSSLTNAGRKRVDKINIFLWLNY